MSAAPVTPAPPSPAEFPVHLVAVAVFLAVASTFLYLLLLRRCLATRRRRRERLSAGPGGTTDPRMAGVRADQPIQFVVPTTATTIAVTTEESVSETDYSSSGGGGRRRRSGFQIDPADLQRGLYAGHSSRGPPFPVGQVGFSLRYDLRMSRLTVLIIGARNLPRRFSVSSSADNPPCVAKLVLLPDGTARHTTRVPRNASCPHFGESFAFGVRRDELPDKRLKMSVWDYDRFSRKSLVGRVVYRVQDSGLTAGAPSLADATSGEIWIDLAGQESRPHQEEDVCCEVLLSLCYDPDSAVLTLTVLKIRGLAVQRDKGAKETPVYSKVTLYVRGKLVRTKKTPSRKKAPEVAFDSPFSIHVPRAALREVDLAVTLRERRPLGGRRTLGRTRTGANCPCEQGLQHWQDMLASPKSTCAQWHVLCRG